jgi:EmrB/QacA subfamily drug resistance transporter
MSRLAKIFLITTAGNFLVFLDVTVVNIAFPSIRASFDGISLSSLSWVLNAYNVIFAALLIPAGRLANTVGRKRLFLIGLGIFTVASLLCAIAPSAAVLVGARSLQAVGAAILTPTSLALLLIEYPIEKRFTAISLWVASTAVAAAFGPSIGGLLVELDSWRLVFVLNLPFAIVALIGGIRHLDESKEAEREPLPDFVGTVLVTLAFGLLALGLVQGGDWGWTSARVVGSFVVAAVLLPTFVWRTLRHRSPVVDPALLKLRSLAVANAATFIFGIGFYALLLCNILFLTNVWGYSVLEAGLVLTPAPFATAISARIAGTLMERRGEFIVCVVGLVLFGLGATWYATQTDASASFVAHWLPGALLTGSGAGFVFPALSAAAVVSLPPNRFSEATGVLIVARQIGAVLGVALLVAVVGSPSPAAALDAFHSGWIVAIVSSGVAAVVSFGLAGAGKATPVPADVEAMA